MKSMRLPLARLLEIFFEYIFKSVNYKVELTINLIQQSLNSSSKQVQTMISVHWRFGMVRIFDSCLGWK